MSHLHYTVLKNSSKGDHRRHWMRERCRWPQIILAVNLHWLLQTHKDINAQVWHRQCVCNGCTTTTTVHTMNSYSKTFRSTFVESLLKKARAKFSCTQFYLEFWLICSLQGSHRCTFTQNTASASDRFPYSGVTNSQST